MATAYRRRRRRRPRTTTTAGERRSIAARRSRSSRNRPSPPPAARVAIEPRRRRRVVVVDDDVDSDSDDVVDDDNVGSRRGRVVATARHGPVADARARPPSSAARGRAARGGIAVPQLVMTRGGRRDLTGRHVIVRGFFFRRDRAALRLRN